MYIKIKILVKRGKTLKYKKEILQLQGKIDMEKKKSLEGVKTKFK